MLEAEGIMTHVRTKINNEEINKFTLSILMPPMDDWGIGPLPWKQGYPLINRKLFAELQAIEKLDILDEPDRKKPGRKKKSDDDSPANRGVL